MDANNHSADWAKAVTTAVVPVVMISACSLMSLAFYNRLAVMVTRLRAFQRECLENQEELHLHPGDTHSVSNKRKKALIDMLRQQTGGVLRRAKLLQSTLTFLLSAICLLILSSLALGLSAFYPGLLIPAAVLFFIGCIAVFTAVCFAIAEIRAALDPIQLESRFVQEMVQELGTAE
jgi:hypothetical protein